jgi:hypothetical protein
MIMNREDLMDFHTLKFDKALSAWTVFKDPDEEPDRFQGFIKILFTLIWC